MDDFWHPTGGGRLRHAPNLRRGARVEVLAACAHGGDDLVARLPDDYGERTAILYGELLSRVH